MLFGIGIGFIIASLLMFFAGPSVKKLSPAEIELAARELGMVYREEVLALEENSQKAEKQDVREKAREAPELAAKERPTTQEVSQQQLVQVRIVPGSTPRDIAELLKDRGVLTDVEGFLQVVYERKLQRKLRAGYFEFSLNSSPEEILKKITNQQEGKR